MARGESYSGLSGLYRGPTAPALHGQPAQAVTTIPRMTVLKDVPRQWRCRLCGFDRVAVMRKNGVRYETSFLACSGCSVMFMNENQFDALGRAAPSVEFPPVVVRLRRAT